MHGQVDPAGSESFFDLLREHAFRADFGQGRVGDFVPSCLDNFDLNFITADAQKCGDVVGLPEGELGAAGTDSESKHQRPGPTSFLLGASRFPACEAGPFSLSCRLNSRRTTSITVVASASRAAVFSVVIGVCMTLLMMPRVRASTAISCSGVSGPMRPRTRSISAWRMVSK